MRAETELKNFKEFDLKALEELREDYEIKFSNDDYKKFLQTRC